MGFIEEIEKELCLKDFGEDTILYFIAEKDQALALAVSNRFGGEKPHIQKFDTITKKARDRIRNKAF